MRRSVALAVSIGLHALIASLELGDPRFGLPGLLLPWTERPVQAPELTVRLVEAPPPPAPVPPAAALPKRPKPVAPLRADQSFDIVTPAPPRKPKPLARPRRESVDRVAAAEAPARKPARPPEPQQNILALDEAMTETFVVPPPTPPEPEPPRAPEIVAQPQAEEAAALARAEEEAALARAEESRRKAEDESRREQEEARRLAVEAEAEAEARRKAEVERRKEEEAQRLAAEAEAEARRKADVERRKEAEAAAQEEARRKAEVERRKEEEARRLAQEAAAERERLAAEQARAAAGAGGAGTAAAPGALSGRELAAKVLGQLRLPGAVPLTPPPPPPPPPADGSRRRTILAVERDVVLKMYAESWRAKIERNGPLNFRVAAGLSAPEYPIVTVAIRSDGSVEYVHIHRSSGLRELDQAVRRIVESYAPYSKFPPAIASQYDVIEIRRVWQFDGALRIVEETR